jgi:hypothetical protein
MLLKSSCVICSLRNRRPAVAGGAEHDESMKKIPQTTVKKNNRDRHEKLLFMEYRAETRKFKGVS